MNDNSKNLPFEVPQGYFDSLADKIMQGVKASDHQSDTDSELISSISKYQVFEIPEGYFENLGTQVMQQIRSENEIVAAMTENIGTQPIYAVPDNYFDNLSNVIMDRILVSDEDLVDTSELASLKNVNVFEVPKGYFDNLSIKRAGPDVAPVREVKTMMLPKRTLKWTNWAAAACVFFILGMGGIWMMGTDNKGGTGTYSNPAQLASLTLDKVSDEDIEQYIENDQESFDIYSLMDNASASTKDKKVQSNDINTDRLLDNISQEEIEAYLEYEGI